jgi:lipoate-protein ligase A
MRHLCLTLDTPEENLALDEALLDQAELGASGAEVLRIWEPPKPLVVLGRSSRFEQEVNAHECQRQGVPILRRSSGGSAVLAGPGCLMYAVVLSYDVRPHLRPIDQAHAFVLDHIVSALRPLVPDIERQGTSDIAIGDRKFSGNSLRCKRNFLLYHGTILYDFALKSIGQCLGSPARQPEYRAGRDHDDFLINLPLGGTAIRQAIIAAWNAHEPAEDWPRDLVASLVRERYSQEKWNRQFG